MKDLIFDGHKMEIIMEFLEEISSVSQPNLTTMHFLDDELLARPINKK
jgi:hypothetical protein